MDLNPAFPPSPCIRKCCLDDDDICLGCFRSLEEITRWSKVDEIERLNFINMALKRQEVYKNKWRDFQISTM